MLIIDRKNFMFNIKEIYFSDTPFDIEKCDSVLFQFCKNNVNLQGFNIEKKITLLIDLTQDLNTIWKHINDTTKKRIKRAERQNIKIQINENYDEFYKMYHSFIQKKDITSLFQTFGILAYTPDTLKKYGTLFVAKLDNELLAGLFCLEDQFNLMAWVTASKRFDVDREKANLISSVNRLLYWEAIKYAKEKNITNFDFGGLWLEEETKNDKTKQGINFFKLSFGGEIVTRYKYNKNYSKTYNLIYNIFSMKKL